MAKKKAISTAFLPELFGASSLMLLFDRDWPKRLSKLPKNHLLVATALIAALVATLQILALTSAPPHDFASEALAFGKLYFPVFTLWLIGQAWCIAHWTKSSDSWQVVAYLYILLYALFSLAQLIFAASSNLAIQVSTVVISIYILTVFYYSGRLLYREKVWLGTALSAVLAVLGMLIVKIIILLVITLNTPGILRPY